MIGIDENIWSDEETTFTFSPTDDLTGQTIRVYLVSVDDNTEVQFDEDKFGVDSNNEVDFTDILDNLNTTGLKHNVYFVREDNDGNEHTREKRGIQFSKREGS